MIDEHGRVERIPYELCVLISLRNAIHRREVWIEGARRWRNPDEDLPRVQVKTSIDYLKAGHSLDEFLEGFPTVSREQARAYLEMTLRDAGEKVPADASR